MSKVSAKKSHYTQNRKHIHHPSELDHWFKQGLELHQQGDLKAARSFYERVVDGLPGHFDALHLLGLVAAQLKDPDSALRWIGQALVLQPDNPLVHVGMGLALQELKRWPQALAAFDRALVLDPGHAQAHACRGDVLIELGRASEALVSLDQAVALRPEHVQSWHSRGRALRQLGRLQDAMAAYDCAIDLQAQDAGVHLARGDLLQEMGRPQEALASFERAVSIEPSDATVHFHHGNVLLALDLFPQALASYDRSIALDAGHAGVHTNRGNALLRLGRLDEALASYAQALALEPDLHEVFYNQGNALQLCGRAEQALVAYDRALALMPGYAHAWSNRGNTLVELRRLEEAVASYDRALQLRPDYAEAHYNRGNALHEAGRWEEAVASYQQAIALEPGQAAFHYNLGNSLKELNRLSQAVASLEQAIALQPDHAESHWNKSLALLLEGRLAQGWASYEWRWKTTRAGFEPRPFAQPLWLGAENLQGKTVLLHAEQGLGDALQFCRYAERVQALGARVLLEVPGPLVGLMSSLRGPDVRIARGQPLPAFDLQCPLMSLPLAFGTQLHSIPCAQAYLSADQDRRQAWALSLGPRRSLRVGLAWSGNPLHRNDGRRSVPLAELLAHLPPGPEYFSLQKDLREGDLAWLQQRGVRHFGAFLEDFQDTAALCEAMDVVLSVDTSVAHLAGALGRPCWVMLPQVPDWRWLLEREDCPWYPSMRLFRQGADGSWVPVLRRVVAELRRLQF